MTLSSFLSRFPCAETFPRAPARRLHVRKGEIILGGKIFVFISLLFLSSLGYFCNEWVVLVPNV